MSQDQPGVDLRTVTLDPSGRTFSAAPGQRLLEAAREAGVWLPFECGWGSCSTCKVTLISGEVENLLPDAPAVSERDARRGRILVCQVSALTDLTIRPLRVEDEAPSSRRTRRLVGRVVQRDDVGPGIVDLRVDLGEPLEFRSGQSAILEGPNGLRRCYSLAGRPGSAVARFVLKRYEGRPMSTWLSERAPGDHVVVEAPYGDVWIRPGERGLVMIAGGTGISAILSLAWEAASAHSDRPLTVLYGARTPSDLALADEVQAAVEAHGDGQLIRFAESGADGDVIRAGRVTDALGQFVVGHEDVFVAGPPAMVDAVDVVLSQLGVQRDRVFVDRFG